MVEVIPAILAKDFRELNEKILLFGNVAPIIQLDVCDGDFVPNKSWPLSEIDGNDVQKILDEEEGMPYWQKVNFEFDLMVKNAHENFLFWSRLGAKRLVFHVEAEGDFDKFKEFLQGLDMYTRENIDFGIAIGTTTRVENLKGIISNVDFVQCMGIEHIGFQGQDFDPRVLEQIKLLRAEYPELIISVDGSVNEDTAKSLVEAGASRLVVGSALLESLDVRETIKELENL